MLLPNIQADDDEERERDELADRQRVDDPRALLDAADVDQRERGGDAVSSAARGDRWSSRASRSRAHAMPAITLAWLAARVNHCIQPTSNAAKRPKAARV